MKVIKDLINLNYSCWTGKNESQRESERLAQLKKDQQDGLLISRQHSNNAISRILTRKESR